MNRRASYAPSTRSQMSGNGSMTSLSSGNQSAKAIYDYDAQSGSQLSISGKLSGFVGKVAGTLTESIR